LRAKRSKRRARELSVVITIARMYGSGALGVARRLSALLGLPLVDQELPVVVATRLGIAPAAAAQVVAEPKPLMERILGGWAVSAPEIGQSEDIDAAVTREVESAIREAAEHPCIILGRGAGLVLRERNDVLRVFVHAPLQWRGERVARLLSCGAKEAAAEVQRVDRARKAYVLERFGVDWDDAQLYALTADTGVLGIEGAADAIAAAARRIQ
jgi:cytidylate kinase